MKKEFHCKQRPVNGNFCLVCSVAKLGGSLLENMRHHDVCNEYVFGTQM